MVYRHLGGVLCMPLTVTSVTENHIVCGDWTFDRLTGVEIDDVLQWGPAWGVTGSYIRAKETTESN